MCNTCDEYPIVYLSSRCFLKGIRDEDEPTKVKIKCLLFLIKPQILPEMIFHYFWQTME